MTEAITLPKRGKEYYSDLKLFADKILELNRKIGFKISSRGWCYTIEGFNLINKNQFNLVQKLINKCRKLGYLPLDFVAEEKARNFINVDSIEDKTPKERILSFLKYIKRLGYYHELDYWENEEYYIQILVEKIDLVTLFEEVCETYHIPIATSKGWSSILQRAELVKRFKEREEKGQKPVLLYCGDFDPSGLQISEFLIKNLEDLVLATKWNPKNLTIDRFGLNYDFIIQHNLTWIDNLISGSGKKPDKSKPHIKEYIEKYGERKVEANAIVIIPDIAKNLCENTILKYLGKDIRQRLYDKKMKYIEIYNEILEVSNLLKPLNETINLLEDYQQENLDSLTENEEKNDE